ncbi:MAG TPA: ubiquinol-cytochrome c reductase iron-sulfur subunit [Stellaceae bacterium]|nr:ubiquinol-cytochrome c reductase iron-sulfur subunit [Stellaceae bacterium]
MTDTVAPGPHGAHEHDGESRRDFLTLAATAVTAVGAACAVWPLVTSMEPSEDVLAAGAPIDVDISKLEPGQQMIVLWRSRPVFIAHRTADELKTLQDPKETADLRDPDSNVMQQPDYAKNWHRSVKPEYLVVVGICTHLGCIPEFQPQPGSEGADWRGGYFCPCHGSRYDLAARVFQGVPAPYNLPVPPHHFVSDTMIRVGENPPNSTFDLNDVEQI